MRLDELNQSCRDLAFELGGRPDLVILITKACPELGDEIARLRQELIHRWEEDKEFKLARFWPLVNKLEDKTKCWEWLGDKNNKGYGLFRLEKKTIAAHRAAYMLLVGEVIAGKNVCHTCDNPPCVNPNHLFVGTQQENVQDMIDKGRDCLPGDPAREVDPLIEDTQGLEMKRLYAEGKSCAQIGLELHVSKSTVWRYLKRLGLPLQTSRRPRLMDAVELSGDGE
jgi:hypothetical protein